MTINDLFCPKCRSNFLDVEAFSIFTFKFKCFNCGFKAAYENIDKSKILIKAMEDNVCGTSFLEGDHNE